MDYINKELRTEAVLNGLCMQWQSEWVEDKSQDELMEMYKRGIDFCIKHDYPSLEWVEKNLDKCTMNNHNIFLNDFLFCVSGGSGSFVLNGECSGIMEFSDIDVATVYVRHESHIHITCSGNSIVHIVLLDNATLDVDQRENSKVVCILRDSSEMLLRDGNMKVIDRRKKRK